MDESLHRLEAQPVHHFEGGRDHSGGDDGTDRVRAGAHGLEVEQHGANVQRIGCQAHANRGDDAEHSLAADEGSAKIETPGFGFLAAQAHE